MSATEQRKKWKYAGRALAQGFITEPDVEKFAGAAGKPRRTINRLAKPPEVDALMQCWVCAEVRLIAFAPNMRCLPCSGPMEFLKIDDVPQL